MFLPAVENGSWVEEGQVIGSVVNTFQTKGKEVKAPHTGPVFSVNHQAVISRGDALFHLGKEA